MAARELAPGVHQIPLGGVNAFLIDDGDALTLIDAGLPKSGPAASWPPFSGWAGGPRTSATSSSATTTSTTGRGRPVADTPGPHPPATSRSSGPTTAASCSAPTRSATSSASPSPRVNEDREQARRSLGRLTNLEFRVACFGHGRPVTTDAPARVRAATARHAPPG